MAEGYSKERSNLKLIETTEFLEVETLRLDRRRFTKSLYHQLPIEDLFDVPGEWRGRPFVQVMACRHDCHGAFNHLHIVWQKGRTARLAIISEDRVADDVDTRAIGSAKTALADALRVYVIAGLLSNHQVLTLEGTTYSVTGPWHENYLLRGDLGDQTLDLPSELDEWLGVKDSFLWHPSICRLIAADQPRKRLFLPHKLRSNLKGEITAWPGPKEAFEVTTRRVAHELARVREKEAQLEAAENAWREAYDFLDSLEEVFF